MRERIGRRSGTGREGPSGSRMRADVSKVILGQATNSSCNVTHHFNLALAIVLQTERERLLKTRRRIVKCEEGLVRLLSSLALRGSENNLEGIGCREGNGGRECRGQREPASSSTLLPAIFICFRILTSLWHHHQRPHPSLEL